MSEDNKRVKNLSTLKKTEKKTGSLNKMIGESTFQLREKIGEKNQEKRWALSAL